MSVRRGISVGRDLLLKRKESNCWKHNTSEDRTKNELRANFILQELSKNTDTRLSKYLEEFQVFCFFEEKRNMARN